MHATHPYPRRSLIAPVAAALAAIAIAVPVRLGAEHLSFSGASIAPAPATPTCTLLAPVPKPYWITDPLASPLRQLEAPVRPTADTTR
jgi:hypothetical protein